MKNILLFLGLISSAMFLGQQKMSKTSQQKNTVYKNILTPNQMNSQKKNSIYDYGNSQKNLIRKQNGFNNYGDSEIFIHILNLDYYTVELNNEVLSSPYGKFRFFELYPSTQLLSIYHNGYLVFQTHINPISNARMYLEYNENQGLFLADVMPLNSPHDGGGYPNLFGAVITDSEYSQFINHIKNNASFDDDRMELINIKLNSNPLFTTSQIRGLLKLFSFDDKRLEVAEILMNYCVDYENYYLLENEFSFSSNKRKFRKLLLN